MITQHPIGVILLTVICFSLSGCNQHATNDTAQPAHELMEWGTQTGKLSGQVELAGHCGNMPSILPDICQAKPFATDVLVFRQSDGELVQRTQSDAEGRFNLELEPGLYRITTQVSRLMSATKQTVHVSPGEHQHIVLSVHANIP